MILMIVVAVLVLFLLIGCMVNGSSPIGIFKGCISNEEFDTLLEILFNDPKFEIKEYAAKNADWQVWYHGGYKDFNINDLDRFSFFQKRKFYKRLEQYKLDKKLNRHKLTKTGRVLFGKDQQ